MSVIRSIPDPITQIWLTDYGPHTLFGCCRCVIRLTATAVPDLESPSGIECGIFKKVRYFSDGGDGFSIGSFDALN